MKVAGCSPCLLPDYAQPKKRLWLFLSVVAGGKVRLLRPDEFIADEVVTHLVGLVRSTVRVTLEIEAEMPEGGSRQRRAGGHGEQASTEVRQQ